MLGPTMLHHLSIGVTDLVRSARFYDAVLATLGYAPLSRNARHVAYGPPGFAGEPPFAILPVGDGARPVSPRFHLAFRATEHAQVHAFHAAALAHGGLDDGPPGTRPTYDPSYYTAFVIDPDGYRLEAVVYARPTDLRAPPAGADVWSRS